MPDDELDSIFPDIQDLLTADWDTSPGSPLDRDPEHGGVTSDSLDAYLQQAVAHGRPPLAPLATSGGGVAEPRVAPIAEVDDPSPEDPEADLDVEPGTGEPDVQPAPDAEEVPLSSGTEPPPLTDPASTVDINGRTFTRDQIEAFARFSDTLDSDPALQSLLTSYYSGRLNEQSPAPAAPNLAPAPAAFAPAPAPAPSPSDLIFDEADDPRLIALANHSRALEAQLANLTRSQEALATQTLIRSAQEAESLMNRAAASFQQQNNLTDDELARIRQSAARMRVLEPLMSGIDPITGAPTRPDLLSATDRALEIAMYADPTLRQRQIDESIAEQRTRTRKRQKLAGVGGSGGSVSRTPAAPRPGTAEAKSAMTNEVAEMMAGTWNPR